jgi:hypothetical protein
MNLKEIFNSGEDVRDSQIPEKWKNSFDNFMSGQGCLADLDEDGTVKEFIYFSEDFRRWYRINEQSILRDIKITNIDESI